MAFNKIEPTIVVLAKVHENQVVTGENNNRSYRFNKLTLLAGNGGHFDYAVTRNGAKEKTLAVFAAAKPGDLVRLSKCFLRGFLLSNGTPRVQILAGEAEIVK